MRPDAMPTWTADRLDHPAGTTIDRHSHASGQLAFVLHGTMTVEAEEGAWLAPPGRGIWVPPGIPHAARYSEAASLVQLLLPPERVRDLPRECRSVAASPLLRELALEAVRLSPDDEAERGLVLQLILRRVLAPQPGPVLFLPYGRDPRLRRAVALLLAEPGSDIGFEEIAKIAGASPRTLARLFRAETDMAFARWRDHLRVTVAVDRLMRGHPITATALDLGYQSASAFSVMFSRLLGQPPGRFLKERGR
ncbi:MAG TPA: helix-turn-helix transcriptional regulator [Acidisoma sp.]|uniref:AraC family transcriptional regulator n=1 Tax=Acidisoma sp. TaxID=1872115 RepID=UPI002C14C6BC|nr:helix-turn-helix transcriptional regulator [Acidisoma sp.]HTI03434.1 helix-turn-helix transcriptional regulator [Acidisoma sp.]